MKGLQFAYIALIHLYLQALAAGIPLPESWCTRPVLAEAFYNGPFDRTPPGGKLQLTCKENYKTMFTYVECIEGDRWTSPEPPCEVVSCRSLSLPLNGNLMQSCLQLNCTASFSCSTGFWYTGTGTRYCQRDGKWSGNVGICQAILCPLLPNPPNGKMLQSDRSYLSKATVVCDEGYIYSKPDSTTRVCLENNTWTDLEAGQCKAVQCPPLRFPKNGRVLQPEMRSYESTATMLCDKGYIYSNSEAIVRRCLGNNMWSGNDGICEVVRCPELPDVDHGKLSSNLGKYNDKVLLQCPSEYILEGSTMAKCMANGTWSTTLGRCKPPKMLLKILLPIILLIILTFGGIIFYKWLKSRKKTRHQGYQPAKTEEQHLSHCLSFKLKEAFPEEDSELKGLENAIIEKVKRRIKDKLFLDPDVKITYTYKKRKTVFMELQSNQPVTERCLTEVIGGTVVISTQNGREETYHVDSDSIVFREEVRHFLVVDVRKKSHVKDKVSDETIDLDTEYVRLRLILGNTKAARRRGKLNLRPDIYQYGLEHEKGSDVQEQELIAGDENQKYILIRGRAGIGKSTLLQSLLWKWANGDFATQFKAFFMLNLRHFISRDTQMDLARLLSYHSVYNLRGKENTINVKWLTENQGKIAFILDGVDEVGNFRNLWKKMQGIPNNPDANATPLDWCFALMRWKILSRSTVIISSRPFADLIAIEQTLHTEGKDDHLMLVELMGLTRDRVLDFVEKRVGKERQEVVKQAFLKNSILMSVSAITFFCAALCRIIGRENQDTPKLTTYTQITAYIIQMYLSRYTNDKEQSASSRDVLDQTLRNLSRLAKDGLLSGGPDDPPRLFFKKSDFDKLGMTETNLHDIRQVGLLVENALGDSENPDETLSEFVHLSIQEFFGMAALLQDGDSNEMERLIQELSESEQFSMSLLFLYGMAFDTDNEFIQQLSGRDMLRHRQVLKQKLQDVSNPQQALQISHESQHDELAKIVGSSKFEKEATIEGFKLTVIDIKALVFMLKNHSQTHIVKLKEVGLDETSVNEILEFLRQSSSVKELELEDNAIDEAGMTCIMRCLEPGSTLKVFDFQSKHISDNSLKQAATALKKNSSLKTFRLTMKGPKATDGGMKALAEGIKENSSLQEVTLTMQRMTDKSALTFWRNVATEYNVEKTESYVWNDNRQWRKQHG